MMLHCTKCGAEIMLAKYFPATGYTAVEGADGLACRITTWMHEHQHDEYGMFGPTHYTLSFETVNEGK